MFTNKGLEILQKAYIEATGNSTMSYTKEELEKYELLWVCYRSEQMSEKQFNLHLEDKKFLAYVKYRESKGN